MDRISIKITFITREFVNTEFMKSLLAQLNLRENLTWSNIRSERFSSSLSKNAKEETEWVLNNANLWYWYLSFFSFNDDLYFRMEQTRNVLGVSYIHIKNKNDSSIIESKKEKTIRAIRRASDNMTDEDLDKMIDLLSIAFKEAFNENEK